MLTKDFSRTYVPGTPGFPEILAREEYTVCYPTSPSFGFWVEDCYRIAVPINTSVEIPPGGQLVVVYDPTQTDPITGEMVVIAIFIEVCASVWIEGGGSSAPACTTYPAEPYTPAVPAVPARWDLQPIVGWGAGANSEDSLDGDCIASWTMSRVVGVYAGLTTQLVDVTPPERLTHAFFFHQRGGAPVFRVAESGAARSADRPYAVGDEFAIRRAHGVVTYLHNGSKVQVSQVPSAGAVNVGAALYVSGDNIPYDAAPPGVIPEFISASFHDYNGSGVNVYDDPGAWTCGTSPLSDASAAQLLGFVKVAAAPECDQPLADFVAADIIDTPSALAFSYYGGGVYNLPLTTLQTYDGTLADGDYIVARLRDGSSGAPEYIGAFRVWG